LGSLLCHAADAKRVELSTLRQVIDESAALLGEGGRSLASVTDLGLHDVVARAFKTRLYFLMVKHRLLFEARWSDLAASELLVVGYNLFAVNRFAEAITFR
jgi:hypothetical protein